MKHHPRERNRLRVLRAERRLSQIELSQRTGISENRYWRIENGYADATETERAQLARVLKTAPAEIFPEAIAS